jgi:hypothetical protein
MSDRRGRLLAFVTGCVVGGGSTAVAGVVYVDARDRAAAAERAAEARRQEYMEYTLRWRQFVRAKMAELRPMDPPAVITDP